ncbi:hypothetical protein PVW46_07965 [Mameliella sp. AT18]|uniref:hypothetical protein n=1 Tax=Mameliella sp. AT18 TaxID=3028385 RepID=UPI00084102A4|nr:hypothetical protein [Mameliella sp. AT18]MDD9729841.1 hypothetical protein [Mameliella sp. AT18]ODM48486.1 hypothetical protein A9320_02020 [Ruegeria sp. PBVC088]
MTHQTTDPYLRQHEARYSPEERIDDRLASSRRSGGSALGILVALLVGLGVVALIAYGSGSTTTPVDPAAIDPAGAPTAMDPTLGAAAPEAETNAPIAPTEPAVPAE